MFSHSDVGGLTTYRVLITSQRSHSVLPLCLPTLLSLTTFLFHCSTSSTLTRFWFSPPPPPDCSISSFLIGAFEFDFSVASDPETYEQGLSKVSRGLVKYGTTSYCPTIVSSTASDYNKVKNRNDTKCFYVFFFLFPAPSFCTIVPCIEPFGSRHRLSSHTTKEYKQTQQNTLIPIIPPSTTTFANSCRVTCQHQQSSLG